jgi:flagellar assembly protein FliH
MSIDFAPYAYPVLKDGQLSAVAERARVAGHAVGFAAGRREAAEILARELADQRQEHERMLERERTALRAVTSALSSAAARLDAVTMPVLASADASLLAGAVELAEAIVGRELRDDPRSALGRVRATLAAAGAAHSLEGIRVHPRDAALLAEEDLGVPVHADAALAPGDAVVLLTHGILDARVAGAVERARRALEEAS